MKNKFAHGAIRTYSLCSPALIFMTAALSVTVIACLLWSAAVASLASQGTAFANESHKKIPPTGGESPAIGVQTSSLSLAVRNSRRRACH